MTTLTIKDRSAIDLTTTNRAPTQIQLSDERAVIIVKAERVVTTLTVTLKEVP